MHGVLGTADVLEDLLLLGALDGKVVIGSMNRGGLAGTVFEIDDRFTGYDAATIERMGFDGGKMLLRIDPDDPATVATIQACAQAVNDLASRRMMAMVEPFISHRVDGRVHNDLSPEAMIRAVTVASGLGATSAYTWLKLPVVADMELVAGASTLPVLLLGGEVPDDPEGAFAGMRKALQLPNVKGIVAGRSLLYPADGDVAGAVDTAVEMTAALAPKPLADSPLVRRCHERERERAACQPVSRWSRTGRLGGRAVHGHLGRGRRGARGRQAHREDDPNGFWLGPTLLDDVPVTSRAYTEEIFGPVLSVVRVSSLDEAITLVNAGAYGNGTAIFTQNGGAARQFRRYIQAGMIGINVPIPVPVATFSFGGGRSPCSATPGPTAPRECGSSRR